MMQTKRNNVLRIAVAAALAGGAVGANAALLVPAGTAFTAAQVASEMPTNGIVLTASAGKELTAGSAITTFSPSTGQNLQVSVTLNSGALFKTAPNLLCHSVTGATLDGATLNLGGAGNNNATFTLTTATLTSGGNAVNTAGVSACFVTATDLTVTGSHADVTETITYTYGTLSSSSVNGALVQFQTGLTATPTVGTNVVATVVSGYVSVSGGSGASLINAGQIAWLNNSKAMSTATDLSTVEQLQDVLGANSGSITVAGNALLAASATAGLWLISAGGQCASTGAAAAGIASAAGGVSSVTFTGLSSAQLSAGLMVCVQFNTTTPIQAGSITATVGGTAKTGYSLPSTSAQTLMSITRNGASTEVVNLPPSTNADSGFLRIYNNSSGTGNVTATVYNEAGTALVTNCALGSLTAQNTMVLSASSLETTCSITPPASGRYRVVLNGAFSTMRAQALARTGGVLVNLSGDTSGAGN